VARVTSRTPMTPRATGAALAPVAGGRASSCRSSVVRASIPYRHPSSTAILAFPYTARELVVVARRDLTASAIDCGYGRRAIHIVAAATRDDLRIVANAKASFTSRPAPNIESPGACRVEVRLKRRVGSGSLECSKPASEGPQYRIVLYDGPVIIGVRKARSPKPLWVSEA